MHTNKEIENFKKGLVVTDTLLGQPMKFYTHFGIFSPKAIDDGTRFLLDYLTYQTSDNNLDLGCGYGAIGLSLASVCPEGQTYLVDKDFVSIKLSQDNIHLNKLNNATAQLSDGLQNLPDALKFNHIVSNMPAKVGKEQMAIFLHDSYQHLTLGGRMTVVTINGLRDYMKRNFQEIFGNYKKIKQGKDYTIASCIRE